MHRGNSFLRLNTSFVFVFVISDFVIVRNCTRLTIHEITRTNAKRTRNGSAYKLEPLNIDCELVHYPTEASHCFADPSCIRVHPRLMSYHFF